MKLQDDPILPQVDDVKTLKRRLSEILRDFSRQINRVSSGSLQGTYNAQTATPTQGTYGIGDFVRKSDIVEAGGVGNKYIVTGWYCTVPGTPGTWREARVLTGN